jgi:Flp pilus assembly protein TadB
VSRIAVACGLVLWAGATLVLSSTRWSRRSTLADRVRPYLPGGTTRPASRPALGVGTLRDVAGPFARALGERVARGLGVHEGAEARLRRIHAPVDATTFRLRQVGWSLGAFGAGLVVAVALSTGPLVGVLLALGAPVLAFLVLEQRLARLSELRQRQLFLELPVVCEQLAMLLAAGWSLSSALNRIAGRSTGACAQDLTRVCRRIRQGLSESEALTEWAATAEVPVVDRLVTVLALDREATDLGRLISEEARACRRDVHRELVATVERRSQQVWIPVTVATLLPGAIFLTVPFIEALRVFGA